MKRKNSGVKNGKGHSKWLRNKNGIIMQILKEKYR